MALQPLQGMTLPRAMLTLHVSPSPARVCAKLQCSVSLTQRAGMQTLWAMPCRTFPSTALHYRQLVRSKSLLGRSRTERFTTKTGAQYQNLTDLCKPKLVNQHGKFSLACNLTPACQPSAATQMPDLPWDLLPKIYLIWFMNATLRVSSLQFPVHQCCCHPEQSHPCNF